MLLKAVGGDLESLSSWGGHHLLLEEGKESLLLTTMVLSPGCTIESLRKGVGGGGLGSPLWILTELL